MHAAGALKPSLFTHTFGRRAEIISDVTNGVNGTAIKAGLIGEIGISWPMHPNERKALRGAVIAQRKTGASLSIHPGRMNNTSVFEILDLLQEAGANMKGVIICHIDNRVRTHDGRTKIAKAGCYLEYDVFGWEGYLPQTLYKGSDIYLPNDAARIDEIMKLIQEGFLNQILISQDICFKSWRIKYGGRGYAHILNYAVPLMLEKGMTQKQIDTILIDNPRGILTFV